MYNCDYTPLECLSIYRNRDSIEKAFHILKTDLDIFPHEGQEGINNQGMLFIFFTSLIIRTALMRGMVSSGLMQRYSLEKLHVVEDASSNISKLERTKGEGLLGCTGKVSWW